MIIHKGKSTIYSDLNNFGVRMKDDLQGIIDQVKAEIAKQPPGSVLIVTDVTGSHFDLEIIKKFIDYTSHNQPYIKAGAVVGITGLGQTAYHAISISNRIHSCEKLAEALDWLVEQSDMEFHNFY